MAKWIALGLSMVLGMAPLTAAANETAAAHRTALEQRLDLLRAELHRGGKIGGVRHQQLSQERQQIQDLIDRLEAGQAVDPSEIDRLLGTPRPAYVQGR
jgi:hypothetical protein